jgi:competence protein ComEC
LRDPLLAPLAAIAAGILVSRFVPFEIRELLTAIAALFILGLFSLWRQSRVLAGVCSLLAFVFAGALTVVVHRPASAPELDAEGPVILSGCVVEPPVIAGERERFILEIEPGARAQVTVYVREDEEPPRLNYGQRIEFDAKVRRPHNFGNPGAFDYVHYLARQDIYWTASTSPGAEIKVLPGRCGSAFQRAIMNLRAAAMERLEHLYAGDPYNTGMMQAILIGSSFQLQRVWTEQFRSTGTFHAIVISGTHIAVLSAFLLLVLRLLFVPAGIASWITLGATWLYTLVTGWQPPCVRSAAGFTLFMIGRYFYRERRIMNLLAAVAIGFLVLDPEQMFEPSFQLSFLAVGFIGAFATPLLEATTAPLARALKGLEDTGRDLHMPPRAAQFRVELRLLAETVRLWTRLPERAARMLVVAPAWAAFYLFGLLAISAIVQTGLALPMVIYFHRIGFSGLSANAVVVPLFEFLVPIGFVAIFTGWAWVAKLCGWLLGVSRAAVNWHAGIEPHWRIPTPPVWLAAGLAAALIATAIARGRWKLAGTTAVLALLALLCWHPFAPGISPNQLELTAIDVGQGDSLFVSFPNGKLMVIDGGGIAMFGRQTKPNMEIGEDVVSPYLWGRSIRRIDVLALTHAHEDHIGGLSALMENFHVKELWTGAMSGNPLWDCLRDQARRSGVRVIAMQSGKTFDFGGARIDVLAPAADYIAPEKPRNNDSLVMRLSYGSTSFLLTGDMERQIETELGVDGRLAHADVLKVPHHGSKTSSTAAFLDVVRPEFAIISDGYGNSYGHPHADVLARLEERNAHVLRTDLDGLVSIRSDGRRLYVDTGRGYLGSSEAASASAAALGPAARASANTR